ncbi:hypothetical protein BZA05DRAFT_401311 [Tricharina praecox]|uniref:uncharacterized protein n=1 Tax=Tricharina praecox TaxID=43433 RepID=UPI00221EB2C7|nr:uncharacterized protein BZA05DRAFT_401311 [Tricharina praecox]KAI5849724.1 hypothetical protein BZA05DRAFT_401311 [Tricharina praecox]
MSSTCSSPQYRYSSSCSSRSSTGPLSPQTAITTPSSCNSSPKLESSSSFPSPPLSPRDDLERQFYAARQSQAQSPSAISVYTYSPEEQQLGSTSPPPPPQFPISPSIGTPYEREPSAYDEAVNFYLYSPLSPTSIYYEWPSPIPSPSVPEYCPWTEYSGYPPASAFYGPLPLPFDCSAQQESSGCDSMMTMVDLMEYGTEQQQQWMPADERRLEFSAMSLHCAAM